jgi:hypothetical protein
MVVRFSRPATTHGKKTEANVAAMKREQTLAAKLSTDDAEARWQRVEQRDSGFFDHVWIQ